MLSHAAAGALGRAAGGSLRAHRSAGTVNSPQNKIKFDLSGASVQKPRGQGMVLSPCVWL